MSIKAMKHALEALECALSDDKPYIDKSEQAITSLRQAIAELESQEPLAWQVEVYIDGGWSPMGNPQRNKSRAEALASNPSIPKEKQRIVELYAHPPQRTEQEPVAIPKGFSLVAVKGFDELMYWLERCEHKGHLENCPDLIEPYEAFDYRTVDTHPFTEERNFCPRCGKRTNDIHTCTPPQGEA